MVLIQAKNLSKNYSIGDIENMALENISFSVEAGAFAAIVGPSGSGKSTLLNLIGALDHPSSGELQVCATQISTLSRTEAAKFRGDNIGFIFQDFNLIPVLTVFENVEYPLLMVRNWPAEKRRERVMQVLAAVGMVEQAEKKPDQISGGQKQRVAVARALVGEPKLVLADEPTANLDHDTAYRIINLMKQMRDDFGTTFLFSTHDPKIMLEAEQTFVLEDGRLSVTGGAL
ncbi:ABC transporter ATP-binding protein [uncultured Tolumonas sp.]|uniref:ABC transporter ATP-binding protein n=1 Tax=uncultured Tolumonas sp. TaxID=263765 RepID=UPI002A0A145D|nr:ABC transporter ATP-binding protein [uncultured Tolumonas sp.]